MSERETSSARVELGQELNLKGRFPAHTYSEWKTAAEAGLKGAPFEKKLITKTPEGISIQPLYLRGDIAPLPHMGEFPGLFTRSRGGTAAGHLETGWEIAQETADTDPGEAGEALRDALKHGQTSVMVVLSQAFRNGMDPRLDAGDGIYLTGTDDLNALISGVDWTACPIHFMAGTSGLAVAMMLEDHASREGLDLGRLHGSIVHDPFGEWVRNGTLPFGTTRAHDETAALVDWATNRAPRIQVVAADGLVYHEAGADAVSELAFTLATAVDYLADLSARGIPVDQAAPRFRFVFGVGTHFLMEIAKLRAARILWSRAVESFGGGHAARRIPIHARTSRYHQTRYDAHVNILRAATAAFAAVVGGADSIHTAPFDETYRVPGSLSRRVARNTQIVLDAESHFRNLIDPAGGAYAVEMMTHQVAAQAWDLFREVEARGGMNNALAAGFPQERILKVQSERAAGVATRRTVIVGTSHYANIKEETVPLEPAGPENSPGADRRMETLRTRRQEDRTRTALKRAADSKPADWIPRGGEALRTGAGVHEILHTLRAGSKPAAGIQPLSACRAAEPFEKLRDRSEAYRSRTGKHPGVFLANLGPAAQHKARAEFSRGFFEAGGFAVESPAGFDTPQQAATAAADSGAPVVVICSSDDTYPELVPPLVQTLKERTNDITIVVAGYPKAQVEDLRRAGVDEFIHLRADALDLLARIQRRIGVVEK